MLNYILNVGITMLPYVKVALIGVVLINLIYFIVRWAVGRFKFHPGNIQTWNDVRSITNAIAITIMVLGLLIGLTSSNNLPKMTVEQKQQSVDKILNDVNKPQTQTEIVDKMRQSKHNDEDRAKRFDDLTNWKKSRPEN